MNMCKKMGLEQAQEYAILTKEYVTILVMVRVEEYYGRF